MGKIRQVLPPQRPELLPSASPGWAPHILAGANKFLTPKSQVDATTAYMRVS